MDRVPALVRLRYHRDMFMFLIELAIQTFFIKKHCATYSEFYYDISREQTNSGKFRKGLTVLVGAFIPLLKEQFDLYFNRLKGRMEEDQASLTRFQRLFVRVYPFVNLLWESAGFLYAARYLLDEEWSYFTFLHHILRQKVVKRDEATQPTTKSGTIAEFAKKYFVFIVFLGMKLLEWYFDSSRRRTEKMQLNEDLKVNPPYTKEATTNNCPLCHKKVTSPCCLNISGYVFCQSCIYEHVNNHSRCPVTGIAANISNIHRLYV